MCSDLIINCDILALACRIHMGVSQVRTPVLDPDSAFERTP